MQGKVFLCACLACAAFAFAESDVSVTSIAESGDIRKGLYDSLLCETMGRVLAYKPRETVNPWGTWRVSVESRSADRAFYIVISPRRNGSYELHTQGTWIIKRSADDGSFVQAKIFLQSNLETFARVYPYGDRSRIDIVAHGGVLYREVIVPLSFKDVLVSSFGRVMAMTSDVIDWQLFSPCAALYADTIRLTEAVRARIPELRFADDGALDADGRAVYIATSEPQKEPSGLNCSGFAKWLIDGIIAPAGAPYTSIAALKRRMTDERGSSFTKKFEEQFDPFFGLDWSRALGAAAWTALYPSSAPDACDVRASPPALYAGDGRAVYENFPDTFDDAGLDIRALPAMLFILANKEPGYFYIAAFNSRSNAKPYLRQFFHIAVLFPYFDAANAFHVAVFESAAETSLGRIMRQASPYSGYEFVKLIRVPVSAQFRPPMLPSKR